MANNVYFYSYLDASAPQLSGTYGDLITVLNAILVNGYGTKVGAGWTKPYSGTNKAVYKSGTVNNNSVYFRVTDDGSIIASATDAYIQGYESMTDVDTGTANWAGTYVRKSNAASATTRPWYAIADDRTLYMTVYDGSTYWQSFAIGRFTSFKPGDGYNNLLVGNQSASSTVGNSFGACVTFGLTAITGIMGIQRAASQVGGGIAGLARSLAGNASCLGSGGGSVNYPNGVDGAYWVLPALIFDGPYPSYNGRGKYAGILENATNTASPGALLEDVTDVAGYPGRTFKIFPTRHNTTIGQIIIDVTGPWS